MPNNEPKFTPGPIEVWLAPGHVARFSVTGPSAAAAMCADRALEESDVCRDNPRFRLAAQCKRAPAIVFGDTEEEALGNAYLYAAAPDMYAALKDVLRIAKAASLGVTGNSERINRAEAALRRARGEV